jgi:MoxR-like ATPase
MWFLRKQGQPRGTASALARGPFAFLTLHPWPEATAWTDSSPLCEDTAVADLAPLAGDVKPAAKRGVVSKGHDVAMKDPGAQPTHLLRSLGLHGLDHLDAVYLASLASEAPLLLIGPHGSAKSALLERTAVALSLEHRHYNASLVSFDDLLGFPVPNAARDGLDYLRTPATLWDAESIFLDEISRCRPEVQNKLFSIVHERRVLGMALERLRYRWAAMNPPAAFDASGEVEDAYIGSQPLDPALADRFAFVVALPSLDELSPRDRIRLISTGGEATHTDDLPSRIALARHHAQLSREAHDAWVVRWLDALVPLLAQSKWPISGRRAVMLRQGVHAVAGAMAALGRDDALPDAALDALRWGLPQRAQGRPLAESKLVAIHREAARLAGEPDDSPLRRIQSCADPVGRIAIALAMPKEAVSRQAFSSLVADAMAAQDVAGRYLMARHLLSPVAARDAVDAATLELLAGPLSKVVEFESAPSHALQLTRNELATFNRMLGVAAKLDEDDPDQASLGNLLYTLYTVERQAMPEPEAVLERDAQMARRFAPEGLREAALSVGWAEGQ